MPKINVYLPDELAEAVKEAGLSVSPICQRALEQAVRRVTGIREVVAHDLDSLDDSGHLARFTARSRTALKLAAELAAAEGSPNVGSGHLLGGLLAEGGNLGLQVLGALLIDPQHLKDTLARIELNDEPTKPIEPTTPTTAAAAPGTRATTAPGGAAGGGPATAPVLRLSGPAAEAVEQTVNEAIALGHNYVGCEHLLLGLIAEQQGAGGRILREYGAEQRLTRRAVAAALIGFAHVRANHPQSQPQPSAEQLEALAALVRRELQPLIERIEQLEARG
ncbi:Clp protease N-terminal domain-containing protein [Kitasatospora sp. NBC_01287]|uniref:Clp protease N-terminal domain-containing protein n=1 Tax=Kitasatospora sp. NBC_01287 TaxID=2903573 RepID=UPI002259AABD|nr:Clp protease N-terminal domain-containing protein [Kitasatospora sp. NBC_01287]MCX4744680.1 Clp protease N-terminal domain-containing protein [Kitasatospora sp. NBC_01287]